MKIYLDMCSLQRPLDTKTQLRISVEAEAILGVLALCESGETELIGSDVLLFEAARTPQPVRKRYAFAVLSRAKQFVPLESGVVERARIFQSSGIKPVDALHLASAVEAKADYFCTCDDKFLNRAKAVDTLQTKVVSPLELITEVAR